MPVRAFLEISSGLACSLVDSSRNGERFEVLNPISKEMILEVREVRRDGSYSQPRTFEHIRLNGRCDACALKRLVEELNVHIDTFVVQKGAIQFGFVATDDQYRRLLKGMSRRRISYRILSVYCRPPLQKQRDITANQRRALRLALETGYFDYPRNSNLTVLSTILGKSPSTVAESLRRAEKRIIWAQLDHSDLIRPRSSGRQ